MRYAVTIALFLILGESADAQTIAGAAPPLVTPVYVAPSASAPSAFAAPQAFGAPPALSPTTVVPPVTGSPPPVTLAPSTLGVAPGTQPGIQQTLVPSVTSPSTAIGTPSLSYGAGAFQFGQPGIAGSTAPPETSSLNSGTVTSPVPTNPSEFVPTNPELNGEPNGD